MNKHAAMQQNRSRRHQLMHKKNGHEQTKGRKESAQNSPKQQEEYHGTKE